MLPWAALTCFLSVCLCFAQAPTGPGKAGASPARRGAGVLFSWQDSKGQWNFSIFEWLLGRAPTLDDIRQYPVLRGLGRLKREIAGLPDGYILSWEDERTLDPRSLKPGDGPRLAVPPPVVLADVRRFATAHHVVIVGPDPPQGTPRK